MRALIPLQWRIYYRRMRRKWQDWRSGIAFDFAKPTSEEQDWAFALTLTQPFLPGEYLHNKIHNIQLAAQSVMRTTIRHNQVFSFWEIVGQPQANKGYKEGRNLINGVLQADVGGGLCQLSGIMYHLSLVAGLHIEERHNHSLDIYTDDTRFSPLGADATVAFAYKDLRIRNTHLFPIRFSIEIQPNTLICKLMSTHPITAQPLQFDIQEVNGVKKVQTFVVHPQEKKLLALSEYKIREK